MIENANKQQIEAITYTGDKPLLIQAGPGAGKTFVLIERIKYLLENTDAKPESFLVITFTRKAAKQLRDRLSSEDVGIPITDVNKMHISTIHSFCSKTLSEYGKSGYILLDDDNDERRKMFIRRYRKELGLTEEAYISGSRLNKVMNKFDEYTSFDVEIEDLQEHIREKCPISQRYLDLIENCKEEEEFDFPYDEVMADKELKESYYNAQYIAIAEAYPKYLDLLEQNNYMDFTLLQKNLLKLLDEDTSIVENSRFKNILIDEFQDTDPIQMNIFDYFLGNYEHVENKPETFTGNYDSFTVVGDDDQSIYGFRGSYSKFFTEFKDNYDAKDITLETNYRSGNEIVDFNEKYMNTVDENRQKNLHAQNNAPHSYVYSINYPAKDKDYQQVEKIVHLIKYLKDSGKIERYSDIGVLFRSIKSKVVSTLISRLDEENINYDLISNESLTEHDEVRAIITLIWYLRKISDKFIPSRWEQEWLTLKAFSNPYFNLSENTINALSSYQEEYENKVIEMADNLQVNYVEENKMKTIVEYSEVFKLPNELKEELFEIVGTPLELSVLTKEELIDLGITEEDYSNFFEKLNQMKEELYSEKRNRDTIIDTYYNLIDFIGIIGDKFENQTEKNQVILSNLASLSTTIANYEEIVWKHDLTGLFWFMNANLDKYPSSVVKDNQSDAVQIMTIHKSKGLEFPVVIVGNIGSYFPKQLDPDKEEEKYANKTDNYYTPIEYLNFKYFDSRKEEVENENLEQYRILYVAMSRAKRLLVLCNSVTKAGKHAAVIEKLLDNGIELIELTDDRLEDIEEIHEKFEEETENIEISFSSYSKYNECPHGYDVEYNYGFEQSHSEYRTYGLIAHSIVDQIHQRRIQGLAVKKEDIEHIISRTVNNNKNIDEEGSWFKKVKEGILKYWNEYGSKWDIQASEYQFYDIRTGYTLTGIIDLIIREGNDITIVDFKTTDKPIDEKTRNKYIEQLSMYAIALKEDPEYKDYNINKGIIYTILNKEDNVHNYNLDEKQLDIMERKIEVIVKNIKEGNFNKRCNKKDCPTCKLF